MAKKIYAVKKGNKPGLYYSWEECQEQIKGFSGAIYKGFSSVTEAQKFLDKEEESPVQKTFYAVKVGKAPGIYNTWDECYAQTEHFPNASYKKFSNYEDAERFLNGNMVEDFDGAVAYINGDCNDTSFDFGYGAVIMYNGQQSKINGGGRDADFDNIKNIAGELVAMTKVLEWCISRNIRNLKLCFCYDGVEKWYTGEWKPNNAGTKKYAKYCNWAIGKIDVLFKKVANNDKNMITAKEFASEYFGGGAN